MLAKMVYILSDIADGSKASLASLNYSVVVILIQLKVNQIMRR